MIYSQDFILGVCQYHIALHHRDAIAIHLYRNDTWIYSQDITVLKSVSITLPCSTEMQLFAVL